MIAIVRARSAVVCSARLRRTRNASEIQVKFIQKPNASRIQLKPIRNQPQNPKTTNHRKCPPRPACRVFKKACSPPHPGVARTTPGIVRIS